MWRNVAAVAAGGVIGALARYGLSLALPTTTDGFPWATWLVNVSGCLLIGALMAWLSAKTAPHWLRPLLGIGVLGGYTTFSTFTMEALRLGLAGRPLLAVVYVFATLLGVLTAVFLGSRLTRKVLNT